MTRRHQTQKQECPFGLEAYKNFVAAARKDLTAVVYKDLIADVYKDYVKGTIALQLEGCKSMATGCATLAALYGAVVGFVNYGHPPKPLQWQAILQFQWQAMPQWEVIVILLPFVIWAISGLIFGSAYLPKYSLEDILTSDKTQQMQLTTRDSSLRNSIRCGSGVFWLAVIVALYCVAFVRVPDSSSTEGLRIDFQWQKAK